MENTEILDGSLGSSTELGYSDQAINYLNETAKWGFFLAIVGFIFIGIMIVFGIIFGISISAMPEVEGFSELDGIGGAAITIFYIALALFYLYPTIQLFKFSTTTKTAVKNNNTEHITTALGHMKSFFKYIGIFTLCTIVLYTLILIFGMFFMTSFL